MNLVKELKLNTCQKTITPLFSYIKKIIYNVKLSIQGVLCRSGRICNLRDFSSSITKDHEKSYSVRAQTICGPK